MEAGPTFVVVSVLVAFFTCACFEGAEAQQFTQPVFMLLWRAPSNPTKRETPEVVDLKKLVDPILQAPPVSYLQEGDLREKRATVLDYVNPTDTSYEWLAGVGPFGFIELTGAFTSFNRPLFDYDALMNSVYQANYNKWANQTDGWDTYDLWSRRNIEMGAARQQRATDANGYEENWMGRTGVSPFRVTKVVDKLSPELFRSAFATNQIGSTPDLFEVLIFFRLEDAAASPYTVIRLHHAVLSDYQFTVQDRPLPDNVDNALEEELWFDYARMDYGYATSIRDGCNAGGCPYNPATILNCRLGILYDFPYNPVITGCPTL